MIARIYAHGFKGMDFDQPLALRTVIMGRIGSGKSSRALALALLATGSLPGTGIAKSNSDILNAVGNGNSLTVGLQFDDGVTLERTYRRKQNGSVGCAYLCSGETTPKNLFERELDRRGVNIADVAAFLALSDAKKVDELFRLFPPAGDVRGLGAAIASAKERISELESAIRGKEQSCRSLSESLAGLNLPAGSLPEVQAAIAQTEREYQAARDELTRKRLEQEQARLEREKPDTARQDTLFSQSQNPIQAPTQPKQTNQPVSTCSSGVAVAALERVLSALRRAGCEGCAAQMVLRRELKQLRAEADNG